LKPVKKILVAPLDWGLGHATRCIPIVQTLLHEGHQVVLAGNSTTQHILQQEFPELSFLDLPGYDMRYTASAFWLPWVLFKQIPKMLGRIKYEHAWLQQVVKDYQIDLIISDNRYGLYHEQLPSFIMCHQLQIQVPQSSWLHQKVNDWHAKQLARFRAVWIPDYVQESMAGQLSKPDKGLSVQYLGNLSRFQKPQVASEIEWDIVILLSGPEPQRTILEELLMKPQTGRNPRILLVRGKPESEDSTQYGEHVTVKSHLQAKKLQTAILQARLVICRSGYSTVMDLCKLHQRAILIPTPGQTEQEYLADYLMQRKWFFSVAQSEWQWEQVLAEYAQFQFDSFPLWNMEQYQQVLLDMLNDLSATPS